MMNVRRESFLPRNIEVGTKDPEDFLSIQV